VTNKNPPIVTLHVEMALKLGWRNVMIITMKMVMVAPKIA